MAPIAIAEERYDRDCYSPMIKFLAVPPYTPGHAFSGRASELQQIDDWAASPEQPVLVIEAIGGMGKSMLCWHWVKRAASQAGSPFAGFFWYSFYERGADMADFCAHALAFITSNPVDKYRERKTADLAAELVPLLQQRPWLLVLDGLERILVAYNRYDAAQIRDDELNLAAESVKRTALDCILPADSHLLPALIHAFPTKVLISSRLMPSALIDSSGTAIAGVLHHPLAGLDPDDAEAMLRGIQVSGDSISLRRYLGTHFGYHPLMVGVLGGLVKNFSLAPGDFDRWLDSQDGRGTPTPEALDVIQDRNRVLKAAFNDLEPDARTLLARIGLVSEAVDDETMVELNPRRPDRPIEVKRPKEWQLDFPKWVEVYHKDKAAYEAYQAELDRWRNSPALAEAETFLRKTIRDLSSRGLLQCDYVSMKYDLHPVVRGYAVSSISPDQQDGMAQRVVDHFSSRMDVQSEHAKTTNDLRNGLQVARTLLHLGRTKQAASAVDNLSSALFWSLEAWDIYLALAKPLFPDGWTQLSREIDPWVLNSLLNDVALALNALGKSKEAVPVGEFALDSAIEIDRRRAVLWGVRNLALYNANAFQLSTTFRLRDLEATLTPVLGDAEYLALYHLSRSTDYRTMGNLGAAREHWRQFDALPRPENRSLYRPGYGEYCLAELNLHEGLLDEAFLVNIGETAKNANSRWVIRALYWLRGEWKLSLSEWGEAAAQFEEHIRMTREVNLDPSWSEARLAFAHVKLGQHQGALLLADRLSKICDPPHAALAELYLALDEQEKAGKAALAGYTEAWGDGAPFVAFRPLQQCRKVFHALGGSEPQLRPFDPASVKPFAFEEKLIAYVNKKEEKNRAFRPAGRQRGDRGDQSHA